MSNKNSLSKNTRAHSKLDDIQPDQDIGFEVEFEDAYIPEEEPKYPMALGQHKLRAVSYDKIEEYQEWTDEYGEVQEIAPHWSIAMEDIRTGELDYIEFPIDPKKERSFKLAVNTRSGRDLGSKIAPKKVEALTVISVIRYLAKFPVEFRYDFSHWIDENNEAQTSKKPKIQLWNPEDFQSRKHTKNWVSLR